MNENKKAPVTGEITEAETENHFQKRSAILANLTDSGRLAFGTGFV
jgi:hypothetical protein